MIDYKVTPGMIAAGADILWDGTSLDVGRSECESLAEWIFLAMQEKERAEIDAHWEMNSVMARTLASSNAHVTPKMIEAGVEVFDDWGDVASSRQMALMIYLVMRGLEEGQRDPIPASGRKPVITVGDNPDILGFPQS